MNRKCHGPLEVILRYQVKHSVNAAKMRTAASSKMQVE